MRPVVAIDGPAGSGKSTVARGVGRVLGLDVLDTGAMYRAVALLALERGLPLEEGETIAAVARASRFELPDPPGSVLLDGRDVTAEIRGPAVSAAVSQVAAHPEVRALLVARQRAWVDEHEGGVVEGRDIGTVVFPEAPVKVFLTATDEERARRRKRDEEAAARNPGLDDVQDAMLRRDAFDSARAASPLRAAPDALVIDTTGREVDDVVAEIVRRFRSRIGASS